MKAKGFYSSTEAILSLLTLLAVLLSVGEPREPSLENLYILQKEHDLLKVWAKKGIPPMEEMVADFEFVFPGKSGEIKVNETMISVGKTGWKEAVSATMLFFGSGMNKTHVSLRVFK